MSVSGLRDEPWCRAHVACLDVFSIELLRYVLVAGASFAAIHNILQTLLKRNWTLPRNGRKPLPQGELSR
jgi:hypothetical protein